MYSSNTWWPRQEALASLVLTRVRVSKSECSRVSLSTAALVLLLITIETDKWLSDIQSLAEICSFPTFAHIARLHDPLLMSSIGFAVATSVGSPMYLGSSMWNKTCGLPSMVETARCRSDTRTCLTILLFDQLVACHKTQERDVDECFFPTEPPARVRDETQR
jgi:hypothetical protein